MGTASGNRQNIRNLQRGYATSGQKTISPNPTNQTLFLHSYSLYNGSGSACDLGLGISYPSVNWKVLQYQIGSVVDVTASLQAGTATTIVDTTTGHGYIVECSKHFGYLAFTLSQASTGSPVFVYEYWNGSAWVTLTNYQSATYSSTGFTYVTFAPPVDWVQGDGGLTANNYYAVRVRATTATGTAVQATALRVSRWLYYNPQVSATGRSQAVFEAHPYMLEGGEALSPYFSAASALNSVEATYQYGP